MRKLSGVGWRLGESMENDEFIGSWLNGCGWHAMFIIFGTWELAKNLNVGFDEKSSTKSSEFLRNKLVFDPIFLQF